MGIAYFDVEARKKGEESTSACVETQSASRPVVAERRIACVDCKFEPADVVAADNLLVRSRCLVIAGQLRMSLRNAVRLRNALG